MSAHVSSPVLRPDITVRKNVTTPRHDGVTARDRDGRAPRRGGRLPAARTPWRRGFEMLDVSGTQHLLLAETLGLAMARRASDILERHRSTLPGGPAAAGGAAEDDDDQFAVANAIFTA